MGSFCLSQFLSNDGEHLFEIVLQSTWGLSSPGKQVARSSIYVRKRVKFGVLKVKGGQNVRSVGNDKNFDKQA